MLKAENRYYWSTRRQLEVGTAYSLERLAFTGFPISDPETIPDYLRVLPMFIAAQLRSEPCAALETLISEAIEYVDPNVDDARMKGRDPRGAEPVAYKTVMLKQMFGLTPQTRGKSYDDRFGLVASEFSHLSSRGEVRKCIRTEYLPDVASYLCTGAADRSPDLPDLDELVDALDKVITKGLPLMPDVASAELLAFLPVVPFAESTLERVARMDRHLRSELEVFELDYYAEAARIYFAAAPGTKGTKVEARMQRIGEILPKGGRRDNVRKGVRSRVLEGLAWQLYRAKLEEQNRYVSRSDSETDPREL